MKCDRNFSVNKSLSPLIKPHTSVLALRECCKLFCTMKTEPMKPADRKHRSNPQGVVNNPLMWRRRCGFYCISCQVLRAFPLHNKVLCSLFHCSLPPDITMYKIQRGIIWKSHMNVQKIIWKMIMPVSPFLTLALYRAGVKIATYICKNYGKF